MLEPATLHCPYCGEAYETFADLSEGSHDYIEDCPVCCRPIEIHCELNAMGELASISARRDDD